MLNANEQVKVGLVLSGGGAKGAYQVGVVRALAELGITVDAVSGASIGSLNAAMVAGSPSLHVAAQQMQAVWSSLTGNDHPLQLKTGEVILKLLVAVAAVYGQHTLLAPVASLVAKHVLDSGLCCPQHVERLVRKSLPLAQLSTGLPLWVSAYPSDGLIEDMKGILQAILGTEDTKESTFFRLNALKQDEQVRILLASGAIPLAFPSQKIKGQKYVDGGIGGWQRAEGNTPIKPLVEFGCTHVLVTHLSDGSLWSRFDFPNTTVLEIRPQGIERGLGDLLDFSGASIEDWIDQGHRDAVRCIEPIRQTLKLKHIATQAQSQRDAAVARLLNDGFDVR